MFPLISLFFFAYFSIIAVYIVFLPKILQNLGYISLEIGIVFAIAPLARFIVPFLFKKFFELNLRVFYFALFLALSSAILFYFTIENFYFFIFPNILFGISIGLILPFIEVYALEYLGKNRFGKSRLFGSLGFMLTSIFLANFLNSSSTALNFFLFFIVLMSIFSTLITLKDSHFKQNRTSNAKINFKQNWGFWLNLFLMQVSFGAYYNFFTIYQTNMGVSLSLTGWMWSFGVVCEIVLFYFQGQFLTRFKLLNLVQISSFLTSIRWLLLFAFPGIVPIIFFAQAFHAFSFALHHSAAFTHLKSTNENSSLAAQFYYGLSFGLGAFLGALLAGLFYGENLYLWASLVALIAGIFTKFTSLKQNF